MSRAREWILRNKPYYKLAKMVALPFMLYQIHEFTRNHDLKDFIKRQHIETRREIKNIPGEINYRYLAYQRDNSKSTVAADPDP